MADYLTIDDLYKKIGSQHVDAYFNDDGAGTVDNADDNVQDVLDAAEAFAASMMLRHYSTAEKLAAYARNDAAFRGMVAWIGVQFASERRPEFTAADGSGAWQTQFDRAEKYIENVSKGLTRGLGETGTQADPGPGAGANTGGAISPKPPAATRTAFTFAPNKQSNTGHGGFAWPLLLAVPEVFRFVMALA